MNTDITFTDADGTEAYSWDGENRLRFSIAGDDCHTFLYDSDGLRRSWERWAVGWPSSRTTPSLWDGQNLLISGPTFVQSPGLYGEPLIVEPDGWRRFFHYDGMGSTTELSDEDETVTDIHRYKAFGGEIYDVHSASASSPPFKYVGKLGYYRHLEAGLGNFDYLRARWLLRDAGRFLSRDPILMPGSPYPYALGNPMNWVDPSGMFQQPCNMSCNRDFNAGQANGWTVPAQRGNPWPVVPGGASVCGMITAEVQEAVFRAEAWVRTPPAQRDMNGVTPPCAVLFPVDQLCYANCNPPWPWAPDTWGEWDKWHRYCGCNVCECGGEDANAQGPGFGPWTGVGTSLSLPIPGLGMTALLWEALIMDTWLFITVGPGLTTKAGYGAVFGGMYWGADTPCDLTGKFSCVEIGLFGRRGADFAVCRGRGKRGQPVTTVALGVGFGKGFVFGVFATYTWCLAKNNLIDIPPAPLVPPWETRPKAGGGRDAPVRPDAAVASPVSTEQPQGGPVRCDAPPPTSAAWWTP